MEDKIFSTVWQLLVSFMQELIVKGALLNFKVTTEEIIIHDLLYIVILLEVKSSV